MRKILSILVIALLSITLAYSQDEVKDGWKKGGMGSISFSQVSLTNWAAGGENSVSGNLLFSAFANMTKGEITWDNNFDFAYGILKQGDKSMRKSDDKLELSSKFGKHAFKSWYYSGLFNFRTQLSTGYEYADLPENDVIISNFLAPAYLTVALGMDYKPNDNFSVMISPVAGKVTIVNDTALSVAYGVEQGKTIRNEFGGFVKMSLKKELMENVNFQTKLDLFSNYLNNPQNIDVNWEVLIAMKINKYLTASLSTTLLYDDDINILDAQGNYGPRIQFKEVFGIGLSYNF